MKNTIWEPFSQYKLRKELERKHEQKIVAMMFGNFKKSEPEEDKNVKLAWVMVAGKRKMLGVDNKTMAGYQINKTIPTWEMPLVPEKYDSFVRWCTGFDV